MNDANLFVRIDNLTVVLGGRTILQNASISFAKGEIHAITGVSGVGKSVLCKALVGILPHGSIRSGTFYFYQGQREYVCDPLSMHYQEQLALLRKHILYVHQEPTLLDDMTVLENWLFVLLRTYKDDTLLTQIEAHTRISHWLDKLSLRAYQGVYPPQLPSGALRLAALGRALCQEPIAIVADEPTTGLDPQAAREVDAAFIKLRDMGSTILLITHDQRSLHSIKPHRVRVHGGQVIDERTAILPDHAVAHVADHAVPARIPTPISVDGSL